MGTRSCFYTHEAPLILVSYSVAATYQGMNMIWEDAYYVGLPFEPHKYTLLLLAPQKSLKIIILAILPKLLLLNGI